jgi:hypothetical protein
MIARIKRLARRTRGMEALQAVTLIGAGFVVTWGLMTIWDNIKDKVKTAIQDTATGNQTGAKAAAP